MGAHMHHPSWQYCLRLLNPAQQQPRPDCLLDTCPHLLLAAGRGEPADNCSSALPPRHPLAQTSGLGWDQLSPTPSPAVCPWKAGEETHPPAGACPVWERSHHWGTFPTPQPRELGWEWLSLFPHRHPRDKGAEHTSWPGTSSPAEVCLVLSIKALTRKAGEEVGLSVSQGEKPSPGPFPLCQADWLGWGQYHAGVCVTFLPPLASWRWTAGEGWC